MYTRTFMSHVNITNQTNYKSRVSTLALHQWQLHQLQSAVVLIISKAISNKCFPVSITILNVITIAIIINYSSIFHDNCIAWYQSKKKYKIIIYLWRLVIVVYNHIQILIVYDVIDKIQSQLVLIDMFQVASIIIYQYNPFKLRLHLYL